MTLLRCRIAAACWYPIDVLAVILLHVGLMVQRVVYGKDLAK